MEDFRHFGKRKKMNLHLCNFFNLQNDRFEYCSQLKLHRFASWKNYMSVNSFLPLSKMTKSFHQTGFTFYLPEFWRSSTKFSRFARILPGNVEFNCYHIIYLHQPKSPKSPSRSSPGHHYQDSSSWLSPTSTSSSRRGHLGIIISKSTTKEVIWAS